MTFIRTIGRISFEADRRQFPNTTTFTYDADFCRGEGWGGDDLLYYNSQHAINDLTSKELCFDMDTGEFKEVVEYASGASRTFEIGIVNVEHLLPTSRLNLTGWVCEGATLKTM